MESQCWHAGSTVCLKTVCSPPFPPSSHLKVDCLRRTRRQVLTRAFAFYALYIILVIGIVSLVLLYMTPRHVPQNLTPTFSGKYIKWLVSQVFKLSSST